MISTFIIIIKDQSLLSTLLDAEHRVYMSARLLRYYVAQM